MLVSHTLALCIVERHGSTYHWACKSVESHSKPTDKFGRHKSPAAPPSSNADVLVCSCALSHSYTAWHYHSPAHCPPPCPSNAIDARICECRVAQSLVRSFRSLSQLIQYTVFGPWSCACIHSRRLSASFACLCIMAARKSVMVVIDLSLPQQLALQLWDKCTSLRAPSRPDVYKFLCHHTTTALSSSLESH